MNWLWPLLGAGGFIAFIYFCFWGGRFMDIREQNDRRLPLSRQPFEVCPSCGAHEPIRVGLAIQCSECGEFLRPMEAA